VLDCRFCVVIILDWYRLLEVGKLESLLTESQKLAEKDIQLSSMFTVFLGRSLRCYQMTSTGLFCCLRLDVGRGIEPHSTIQVRLWGKRLAAAKIFVPSRIEVYRLPGRYDSNDPNELLDTSTLRDTRVFSYVLR